LLSDLAPDTPALADQERSEMSENGKTPRPTPRLKERYQQEIVPALMKEFGYSNVMQAPRISKIAVNIGLGEALTNSRAIEAATGDLAKMTGQRPVVTKARHSIATYKLREGMPIGAKVTLRGARMWDFLDRLINVVLPRQRDFQGISPDSFDGRGNYSLGLREQLVFPEIDYDSIDKVRGLEVTIVTTAGTDEEARRLLALMDMPFRRS
jgi:large subunit ribosomal protein L5